MRLTAIVADVLTNLSDPELTVTAVALRQGVTPRYIHLLLEGDGTTFSEFVLNARLVHAYRMLTSARFDKSTITNILAGRQALRTAEVSASVGKGRHTTTHRELIVTPSGGLIIDTPGMRELGLWGDEGALGETFEDIESLAARCRFGDCSHGGEPGCAIRQGLEEGTLDPARLRNYQKMQRELRYLERRQDVAETLRVKKEWKRIAKQQREQYRGRGR